MRVKRGVTKNKHRKNVLARTKGMRGNIRKKERQANEVLAHAGNHAFNDRRKKKGNFRSLWTIRVNAALRSRELTYSKFLGAMKEKGIAINRKMLSELAKDQPEVFDRVVHEVTK